MITGITTFLSGFKLYIYGAVAIAFVCLIIYCKVLSSENTSLIQDNAKINLIAGQQVTALATCDKNTKALKTREDEITKNAQAAVEEAKKQAVVDYKAANDYLFRKPKTIVVTKDNASQFGGMDINLRMTDYLQTKDMMNDAIDARQKEITK